MRPEGCLFWRWLSRGAAIVGASGLVGGGHGIGGRVPESSVQPRGAVRRMVPAPGGRVHVTEYPGVAPPLVLMHGFPDDSRVYDRLVPLLAARRVLTLDWLGYGRSERADLGGGGVDHQHELRAVLDSLELGRVVLVGHDASGPDAIDFAVSYPGRVGQLVLLNTYYGHAPSLRLPEMIRLLADPGLTPLADAIIAEPEQRLWLLAHTARQFGMDPADQDGVAVRSSLPQFFGDDTQPDALAAIRAWTADLFPALEQQDTHIAAGDTAALDLPVTLAFGVADHYLSPNLARHLAGLFRHADVRLVDGASHWPQWDQPAGVAKLILQAAHR